MSGGCPLQTHIRITVMVPTYAATVRPLWPSSRDLASACGCCSVGDLQRYDIRYTLAHEIGHAIGLDHPAGAGQIMDYSYREEFRKLQPGDIAGALQLYGERRPDKTIASSERMQRQQELKSVEREQRVRRPATVILGKAGRAR